MIELSEILIFAKKLTNWSKSRLKPPCSISKNLSIFWKYDSKTSSSQEAISGQDSGKQLNVKWEKSLFLISLTFFQVQFFCQNKAQSIDSVCRNVAKFSEAYKKRTDILPELKRIKWEFFTIFIKLWLFLIGTWSILEAYWHYSHKSYSHHEFQLQN